MKAEFEVEKIFPSSWTIPSSHRIMLSKPMHKGEFLKISKCLIESL